MATRGVGHLRFAVGANLVRTTRGRRSGKRTRN